MPDLTALGPGKLLSCQVQPTAEWRDVIANRKIGPPDETALLVVDAASADGSKVFASAVENGETRVLMITGGRRHEILRLPKPQQAFGFDFDGRWLTFGIGYNPASQHLWTAHAWDSESTAEPFLVADNREGHGGPWFFSHAHKGKAAWVQGTGEAVEPHAVHLYDLATRTDRIIDLGPVDGPLFFGDLLLWRRLDLKSDTGRFKAVTLDGRDAGLPDALNQAQPDWYAAADDRTVVWVTKDPRTLYAWRADWPGVREIARIEPGVQMPGMSFPKVSGDLVTWTSRTSFVTDLRTGATFHPDRMAHTMDVVGGAFVVSYNGAGGTAPPSVVPLGELPPLPSC
ncbi:hypothetical protein GCM10022243_31070 [Saccharothrix violaceirubra]|uniref:Uncharacterized protein n=1 Tax=Saccharothrix violaceirubra TaxID=413306 RepID=A0A7W7T664_9PSEU|nr:hypothetical protein [Saccharothrix violaceirubra]MBB4966732.1 hypothetical protein [Saccharothrix violaceirubra]